MKRIIIISLITSVLTLVAFFSFGQQVMNNKYRFTDTTQINKLKPVKIFNTDSIRFATPILNVNLVSDSFRIKHAGDYIYILSHDSISIPKLSGYKVSSSNDTIQYLRKFYHDTSYTGLYVNNEFIAKDAINSNQYGIFGIRDTSFSLGAINTTANNLSSINVMPYKIDFNTYHASAAHKSQILMYHDSLTLYAPYYINRVYYGPGKFINEAGQTSVIGMPGLFSGYKSNTTYLGSGTIEATGLGFDTIAFIGYFNHSFTDQNIMFFDKIGNVVVTNSSSLLSISKTGAIISVDSSSSLLSITKTGATISVDSSSSLLSISKTGASISVDSSSSLLYMDKDNFNIFVDSSLTGEFRAKITYDDTSHSYLRMSSGANYFGWKYSPVYGSYKGAINLADTSAAFKWCRSDDTTFAYCGLEFHNYLMQIYAPNKANYINIYKDSTVILKATTFNESVVVEGTADLSANAFKPKIYTQATEPDIPNNTLAVWVDNTDPGTLVYYILADIAGVQKKTLLN